ncbi:hypothetical protein Pfo_017208 [Paulownia fortunei]|nr:hypothetical protein Pfo_017208 [Paulownia fortunei]
MAIYRASTKQPHFEKGHTNQNDLRMHRLSAIEFFFALVDCCGPYFRGLLTSISAAVRGQLLFLHLNLYKFLVTFDPF